MYVHTYVCYYHAIFQDNYHVWWQIYVVLWRLQLMCCADLKLKQWNAALDDCQAVLTIEPANLKGV